MSKASSLSGAAAIVGIGATEFSKESGRSELQLSVEVTTIATPPSLSWQQSSRRSGSAIIRELWWSSSVIGRS